MRRRARRTKPVHVLFASLVGTTIEFYDFYIYATAAVLVFPKLFFPASDPASATLASLATFAIAFLARPIGSALFGHFGDRMGRKATLVAALLTMGLLDCGDRRAAHVRERSALPRPSCSRFAGSGRAWDLAANGAERCCSRLRMLRPGKRAWYGMFPQLGAPLGFLFFGRRCFCCSPKWLSDSQFLSFGWRIPFLASAALVVVGLYVRLTITETPVFREALERQERVKVPMAEVFRSHRRAVIAGTLSSIATFVLFYLMTVFALSWATTALGYNRTTFLLIQLFGIAFFAIFIPVGAMLAKRGRRVTLLWITAAIRWVRTRHGADAHCGNRWRGRHDGAGAVADGADVRAAGDAAVGIISHCRALHGRFGRLLTWQGSSALRSPLTPRHGLRSTPGA